MRDRVDRRFALALGLVIATWSVLADLAVTGTLG